LQNGPKKVSSLKQDLGLVATMALVIGMVIGSGIFMKSGKVIEAAGNSTLGLTAWILGGVITLAAGLTVAELGAQIPRTGGLYAYLDEVYGKLWAYLFGWMQTVIYGPAVIGALGLYFSTLLIPFLEIAENMKMPIAIAIIVFLSGINCLGSKYGGYIQLVATISKLFPIALIVVFGLWKGNSQILEMSSGARQSAGMGAAILATLWAYDGWIGVSFVAGEMKNPAKQLPQAIAIGLSIVMIAYITFNMALLHVLPATEMMLLGKHAASTAAGLLFGKIGGKLISIGILLSIFGALNGYILTNARVSYAMAVQRQLPASGWLSRVHSSFGTPVNAMIVQAVLAGLLMIVWEPDNLTDMAMFIVWAFYISAFAAIFILRKRKSHCDRPYSVPGYPLVPIVAIIGALYIVGSTLLDKPGDTLCALGITVAGLPVYLLLNKGDNATKS
jgi:APA family basic amino acid/polyamine antiporter